MDAAVVLAGLSQVAEEVFDDLPVLVCQLRMAFLSGILYVLLQLLMLDVWQSRLLIFKHILLQVLNLILLSIGMVLHMRVNHKGAKFVIDLFINFVLDHAEDVET